MTATSNVNIIRSRPRVEFTALPNRLANDDRLSLQALGLLYYVLTKPIDWNVIPNQLGARFGLSYRKVLKILGELTQVGYVKRELVIENYRITGTKYLVTDEPGFFGDDKGTNSEPLTLAEIDAEEPFPDGRVIIDEPPQEPLVDFRACSKSCQTGKRHPIQRTDSYKTRTRTNSETVATFQGSPVGSRGEASQPYRPSKPDRGRIELEIANRLGDRGFDILMALPESEVEALCARHRRGTLDDLSIITIRNKFMHPT